jgi:hypothetical protein
MCIIHIKMAWGSPFSTLNMEKGYSHETLVFIYQILSCCISNNSNIHNYQQENLKSSFFYIVLNFIQISGSILNLYAKFQFSETCQQGVKRVVPSLYKVGKKRV